MSQTKHDEYDFEMELRLLRPEEGGRSVVMDSKVNWPHLEVDGRYYYTWFFLADRAYLTPGETARVFVWVSYHVQDLRDKLDVGREVWVEAGGKHMGHGTITAMLNFDAHMEEDRRFDAEWERERAEQGD